MKTFSVIQTAKMLGISETRVRLAIRDKELKSVLIKRKRVITEKDILEYNDRIKKNKEKTKLK